MKQSVFFLLLLIAAINLQAQRTFAPPGAEWYYSSSEVPGISRHYVSKDTVIQGKTCNVITQHWIPLYPPPQSRSLGDVYVYNVPDTVFAYNNYFQRFTPLYVFNIVAGDTLKLPVMDARGQLYHQHLADSNFYTLIDSVKNVLYDTVSLKTVYSHNIHLPGDNGLDIAWGDLRGAENVYAERIGSLSGVLPICFDCSGVGGGTVGFSAGLRCYHDSALALKLVQDDCSYGLSEAITTVSVADELNVYPNPSSQTIHLTVGKGRKIIHSQLYSPTGIRIEEGIGDEDLITGHLPDGCYFLQVIFNDQSTVQRKILVAH